MSNIIIPEFYGLGSSPAGWMWMDYPATPTATPLYPTNGRGGITSTIGSAMYGPASPVTLYGITVLAATDLNSQVCAIRNYADSATYFTLTFQTTALVGHFFPANSFRTVTFGAGLDPFAANNAATAGGPGTFDTVGVDLYDGLSVRVNTNAGSSALQLRFWFRPQKLNA